MGCVCVQNTYPNCVVDFPRLAALVRRAADLGGAGHLVPLTSRAAPAVAAHLSDCPKDRRAFACLGLSARTRFFNPFLRGNEEVATLYRANFRPAGRRRAHRAGVHVPRGG